MSRMADRPVLVLSAVLLCLAYALLTALSCVSVREAQRRYDHGVIAGMRACDSTDRALRAKGLSDLDRTTLRRGNVSLMEMRKK